MRLFLIALAMMIAGSAVAAESVEEGMANLAQQIVDRSQVGNKGSIAVAAFQHTDGTCSRLSNYLADELVLSLFAVPGANLKIVERSQLETIFAELSLGLTGAVDPNTAKEIGEIHGVDALVIGSITVLGDQLRIISRMIDTGTGQVFSAAATTIPKTQTIETLVSNRLPGGCDGQASEHAESSSSGATSGGNSRVLLDGTDVAVELEGVRISEQGEYVVVALKINNKTGITIPAVVVNTWRDDDGPSLVVNNLRQLEWIDTVGIEIDGDCEGGTPITSGGFLAAYLYFSGNELSADDSFTFNSVFEFCTSGSEDKYQVNFHGVGASH